jgi:ketosteroid isomerase-like protein
VGADIDRHAQQETPMLEINIPEVVAEVTEAFQRYERALVANDVAVLDSLFWDNPNTLRFGIAENLYGYASIASFRSTRPAIDLTRRLKNTVIVSYGRDFATANTEFQRVGSRVSGRQSHVWVRTGDGWRIAAAHVSLMPLPREGAGAGAAAAAAS